jgi:hypothetical protein
VSRLRRPGVFLAAAAAAFCLLAGCGRSDAARAEPTAGKAVKALELPGLPAELLGLKVAREDVAEPVSRVDSAFIDGLALYSLRTASSGGGGDLLQATLQVSRFNPGADPTSKKFRETVVNQVGSSKPRAFRLGNRTVYLTTGTKQSIAVWFTGRYMFVLASRADYDEPRTLLRKALDLQP